MPTPKLQGVGAAEVDPRPVGDDLAVHGSDPEKAKAGRPAASTGRERAPVQRREQTHEKRHEEAHAQRVVEARDARKIAIGPLRADESEALSEIFEDVVRSGDGFPHEPPLTHGAFAATWVDPVTVVVGARIDGVLVGAYYLKPNFVGRAAHIANAGYVVAGSWRGMQIGRRLVEDSIWRAPLLGFDAIQFNLVFASNPARALYEDLGWEVVGRLPGAVDGEDCFVYWREVP